VLDNCATPSIDASGARIKECKAHAENNSSGRAKLKSSSHCSFANDHFVFVTPYKMLFVRSCRFLVALAIVPSCLVHYQH
jgi:hypothetical protein